jgi:hypothetical protein
MKRTLLFTLAIALSLPGLATAQTLYKLIGKDGKVTYSEKPPKDFDGKVIPMTIDPNANTATLPKATVQRGEGRTDAGVPAAQRAKEREDRIAIAKDKLQSARESLQDAIDNPGDSDFTLIGSVKGGARRVPTEAYQARIASLEAAVVSAEEELRKAERED